MKRRAATTKPEITDDRVLSLAQLLERIPLTRQSVWKMVREGRFPPPVRLTRSKLGWRWSAVLAWLAEREEHPLDRRPYFGTHKEPPTAA